MTKTVLLIEDEPNIIVAISFILQRAGWRVQTHSDGANALEAIVREAPDVIILDVMLPGRSGFDILGDLRAQETRNDVPVLMLTAKGQTMDRARAEALGVTQFMTKPFANQAVLEAVETLAGQKA
jgi:DNA-binding response OmpR family regulator